MFSCYICFAVSFTSFLQNFQVSSCDYSCADKPQFTPSRLVVKHGDPTSVSCSACQHDCIGGKFDVEVSIGETTKNGTTISWTLDKMTEWSISPLCFYSNAVKQCCDRLSVTVYKPPDNVSISFSNHIGPMLEGHQYTLQCTVWDVAPVQNLVVTFYRGQTALGHQQLKNNRETEPVTESFTLNINTSKEDDGAQYWCHAKLELGPEGPQQPPVVESQRLTASVLYGPQLEFPLPPGPIIIFNGNPLQLNFSAVGNPRPSYNWELPSNTPSPSNSNVLTIDSVTSAHEGLYTCSVHNSRGTLTVTFNVEVKVTYVVIIVIVTAVVVLVFILGLLGYVISYQHNRKGQYNLIAGLCFHKQHSAVPTVE